MSVKYYLAALAVLSLIKKKKASFLEADTSH